MASKAENIMYEAKNEQQWSRFSAQKEKTVSDLAELAETLRAAKVDSPEHVEALRRMETVRGDLQNQTRYWRAFRINNAMHVHAAALFASVALLANFGHGFLGRYATSNTLLIAAAGATVAAVLLMVARLSKLMARLMSYGFLGLSVVMFLMAIATSSNTSQAADPGWIAMMGGLSFVLCVGLFMVGQNAAMFGKRRDKGEIPTTGFPARFERRWTSGAVAAAIVSALSWAALAPGASSIGRMPSRSAPIESATALEKTAIDAANALLPTVKAALAGSTSPDEAYRKVIGVTSPQKEDYGFSYENPAAAVFNAPTIVALDKKYLVTIVAGAIPGGKDAKQLCPGFLIMPSMAGLKFSASQEARMRNGVLGKEQAWIEALDDAGIGHARIAFGACKGFGQMVRQGAKGGLYEVDENWFKPESIANVRVELMRN